jgi:parallel beta helix pectate lyase-like protein
VTASQNLGDVVKNHPAGTTYWLSPGRHTLSDGQYDQVIPQAGDVFTAAPGAVLDGRHRNLYAFTGTAPDVTISHLVIENFGSAGDNNNEGVVNHDQGHNWTISANTMQANAGAAMMVGSGNRVLGNCLRNNGQYAFNAYSDAGVSNIMVDGNEISGNNTDDWEKRQEGCGCTGGGKFWATNGATVTNNYVHDNRGVGLWADTNNANFLFQGNYIANNDAEGLMYEISYNAAILNNAFVRNALVKGPTNPTFPAAAIYLSESGADRRVPGPYGSVLRISGNVFTDNWAGVVDWENADRFAGSPANTSSGTTTLVNPSVATEKACSTESKIAEPPYFDDCRWKTQNVLVEHNVFTLDAARVPKCTVENGCGFNGVFSNYGTFPDWSPFKGEIVSENITFKQNNLWKSNSYQGPWKFMAEEAGKVLSWTAWRAAPYNQDAGSSLK